MKQLSGVNQSARKFGSFQPAPNQGDIVHFDFGEEPDPTWERRGSEIAFPHYAIVVSPLIFNKTTGFALVCPITSQPKPKRKYTISIPSGMQVKGTILYDQIRSIDYKKRPLTIIEKVPKDLLEDVIKALRLIIDVF